MKSPVATHRVLYVHRTRGAGVEGVHIDGICGGLRARGFDVTIIAPVRASGDAAEASRGGRLQRMLAWLSDHAPEALFECAEIAYNASARRALDTELARGPVKLIYERYAIFASAAGRRARRAGLPLVLEVNYTAKLPLVRKRSRLLKPLAVAMDRRIFGRTTLLLAVSSSVREHLVRDYGVPREKILLTPNAADPQRFDPATAPLQRLGDRDLAGQRIIGFVGSFAPWHGVDLLLRAFIAIAAVLPDAALLLVGDGPERGRIAQMAEAAGLADRVHMPGQVAHADLPRYVARFDAAVLPDTNDYGSPMKIFEYLAMGRPVVAPDYAPVLDVLEDGRNGVVFRRQDQESLASRLLDVLRDRESARRLGAAGRETITLRRSWQHNVDAVLHALNADSTVPARVAHA
ncbi:MAG TPA: glycosyltransferase family 4 protein [Steroidobacteraceae bacterium]|nr:glycosyltransferase family 4 protein [Steroidobacteraceae bacterium]